MRKPQVVTVDIAKDGEVSISVEGVSGQGCQALSKELEDALGEVSVSKPTEEMYRRETNVQYQREY